MSGEIPAHELGTARPHLEGLAWIPGGSFRMGSDFHYPEESPAHEIAVQGFWIDVYPITNSEFARFVAATGYVTCAERPPDPSLYPDVDPSLLVPGSLVFLQPARPVPLDDVRRWWGYVPGASWKQPEGPGSTLSGRADHPVVHVTHEDAVAYANWCGKALPTEAEWEYAARGGLPGATYVWGDEFAPGGRLLANTWQGEFPWQNLAQDGYERTSPVGAFPPNGYGLFDMAGNVWQWTADEFTGSHARKPCCTPRTASTELARYVVKGGSHLCAPNYCLRYRPSARQGEAGDTSTSHIGFRCVLRPGART